MSLLIRTSLIRCEIKLVGPIFGGNMVITNDIPTAEEEQIIATICVHGNR